MPALPRRLAAPGVSFRARLVLAFIGLVVGTVAVMVIPLFLLSRDQALDAYKERLMAAAQGAAVATVPDTVRRLAGDSSAVIPYIVARSTLRDFLWPEADTVASRTRDSLSIIVASRSGLRIVADALGEYVERPVPRPWDAPEGMRDSLGNLAAGRTPRWWFEEGDRLVAAVPVLDGATPVGVIVARASRGAAILEARRLLLRVLIFPAITLLVAIAAAWAIGDSLTRRIARLAAGARVLATGDLRVAPGMTGRDELGTIASALAELTESLRAILRDVRGGAVDVSAAANGLASGSTELRMSSEQLVGAAGAIAAASAAQRHAIDAIHSVVTAVAEQAEDASAAAVRARFAADDIHVAASATARDARAARETMQQIGAVTSASASSVARLGDKSREIVRIAHAVGELASQANLLSLNAAIEAARAGDQGRGFGVVAEEMRRLATATDRALSSILSLSEGIDEVSARVAESMRHMESTVAEGASVVTQAVGALESVTASIEELRRATHVIAAQATAQVQQVTNVAEHITGIATAARDNAGTAVQVSALAEAQSQIAIAVQESTLRLGASAEQLEGSLDGFQIA